MAGGQATLFKWTPFKANTTTSELWIGLSRTANRKLSIRRSHTELKIWSRSWIRPIEFRKFFGLKNLTILHVRQSPSAGRKQLESASPKRSIKDVQFETFGFLLFLPQLMPSFEKSRFKRQKLLRALENSLHFREASPFWFKGCLAKNHKKHLLRLFSDTLTWPMVGSWVF